MTPDLLAEAGYQYLLDWCMDDQPVWMHTRPDGDGRPGRILAVPYPQELNDLPAVVVRRHSPAQFADMIVDAFEVWITTSGAVAAHAAAQPAGVVPGP